MTGRHARTVLRRAAAVAAGSMLVAAVGLVPSLPATATTATATTPSSAAEAAQESRVLIDDDFPDPTIRRHAGLWYAFATNGSKGNVQLKTSTDLSRWVDRPDALPKLPAWAEGGQTWAPSVAEISGRWHLFYSARHATTGLHCIGRATAGAIEGPYVDGSAQPFVCTMDRRGSIDPSVFQWRDGSSYLIYKSEGIAGREPTRIWSQRLAHDGGAPVGRPVELAVTSLHWEEPIIEGPALVDIGGSLWLLYAGNHWESSAYAVGVAACSSPQGPCMKSGTPLLISGPGVSGPGSPDVTVDGDGGLLLTFAAWTPGHVGYRSGGRRSVRAVPLRVGGGRLVLGGQRAPQPDRYRMVGDDGGVFTFGNASFHGSTGHLRLNQGIVGMSSTPSGAGYWTVGADGGVFAFGDAPFLGSEGSRRLNRPIVDMASTPSGRGYWLVASDGGIFTHGDAAFHGSTGAIRLNREIVGMSATASGRGYWLVASDGGVFAFGDAPFHGSTGSLPLSSPIIDLVERPWATGYWLVASDGGVFTFGDAPFLGSAGGRQISAPIVSAASAPAGDGYWLGGADGSVHSFGASPHHGSVTHLGLKAPIVGLSW